MKRRRLWDSGDGHSFQMNFNRIIKCETHLPPITSQQTTDIWDLGSLGNGEGKKLVWLFKSMSNECESLKFFPSDILIVHYIATELQSSFRGGANWPADKMELKPRHFVIVCGARTLLCRGCSCFSLRFNSVNLVSFEHQTWETLCTQPHNRNIHS